MKRYSFIFIVLLGAVSTFYAIHEIDRLAHALGQIGKSKTEKSQHQELKKMLEKQKKKQQERIQEGKKIKAYEKGEINYDDIVKELQKTGIIPTGLTIEPRSQLSQGANAIVFFVSKKDETGAKAYEAAIRVVLRDGDVEHKKLLKDLNLVQFANQLNTVEDVPLPIIIEPRGGLKIGDKAVIVYDRARGMRLDTLFEKEFANLSNDDIKALFFSMGEQMGNLDRLCYQEKGGIVCHPDSHPGNLLYDYKKERKTGQLYWLDTAGVSVKKGIKSVFEAEESCRLWFLYINMPGLGRNWRNGRFEIAAELNFLLNSLRDPNAKKDTLIPQYNETIKTLQKDCWALKSFGEGYVKRYPAAKDAFNETVKKNKHEWEALTNKAKDVAKKLNLEIPKFPETIQA